MLRPEASWGRVKIAATYRRPPSMASLTLNALTQPLLFRLSAFDWRNRCYDSRDGAGEGDPSRQQRLSGVRRGRPCPVCGSLELWQSVAGDLLGLTPGRWRCMKCDPPTAAPEAEAAERIRRRANQRTTTISAIIWISAERTKSKKLTDQLQQAIQQDSDAVSHRPGGRTISESTLSKFYLGQRGFRWKLNALGECLQLTIHLSSKPDEKGQ